MTKRADYALLALSYLAGASAQDGARLVNTREIAEQFDIPVELLAKILQILAKNGLIASHPGPSGGYRLLRKASAISVAEVVMLIDGPVSLMHCTEGDGGICRQYSRCTIRDPLAEIETRVKNLLDTISIEEISLPQQGEPLPDFSGRRFTSALTVK